MSEFRIMDNNLVIKSNVNVSATSENVNFQASNLKSTFRARVWRSAGNFEIFLGVNDAIDFTDSSSTVAAVITAGCYTVAELIIEIKTQMDAVSVDAFTITHSGTTGLWTIVSDGTTLSLLNNTGASAGSSILVQSLGFASSDLTGSLTYTAPSIAIHTVERFIVDLLLPDDEIDSVAVMFDEQGAVFSDAAVIKIKANPTNIWDSPAVDVTATYDEDNNVITHFFSSAQQFRFWAIEITDPKNANLFVELGGLILAKATRLDHGPEIGLKYTLKDTSKIESTDFGQEYADVFPNRKGFEFNLNFIPQADLETLSNIYNRLGNVIPFGISIDSTETLFDKDRFFNYGKFRGSLIFKHKFTSNWDQSFSHEETF